MRTVVLAALLATTAATPSLAQFSSAPREAPKSKMAPSADIEDARERAKPRRDRSVQPRPTQQSTFAPADADSPPRTAIDRAVDRGRANTLDGEPRPRIRVSGRGQPDSVANWRRAERGETRDSPFEAAADMVRRRATVPADARPDRPAPPPRTAHADRGSFPRWASSWHRDRRYDWRDHRRRHRSLFHLSVYFDPFGWNYRRYDRGWRLWPSYYHPSYWLTDPFMYRLPYAPHPYRWIRYWDDALLVDTYTGEVVDVVHDVFW